MTPAPSPLLAAIRAAWPGCRDAAGADPRARIVAHPAVRGGHWLSVLDGDDRGPRAAENVARALEDLGYDVAREDGYLIRVLGLCASALLPPSHPVNEARGLRLYLDRLKRDEACAPAADAKRVGAEMRDAAAFGRTGT